MYTLEFEEFFLIMRALHFYEDKLTNIKEEYRNPQEFSEAVELRRKLGKHIKFVARID
jgi:hypothetical protein